MIIKEIREIKSGKNELRTFGITISIVLAVFGLLSIVKGSNTYTYLIILSSLFFIMGLLVPILLFPLQKLWMTIAIIIGWFMTRIILFILFFAIFTPISIFTRLLGKDFLDLKFLDAKKSYWKKLDNYSKRNNKTYEKQY